MQEEVQKGYKKTEIGIIPKDWEVKRLEDVTEINPKKIEVEDENIKVSFITMADISDDGIILNKSVKKYKEVNKGYTSFINNDILLAKITPCFENGKKALVKDLVNGIGFGSTEFHVLRGNEKVLPEYIYYYISTYYFREKARLNMTGSAGQRRVPTNFIKNCSIPLPPLSEQQKIASILSTVDKHIEQTDELIEKTKKLKKGLMQKLLTRGIGHTEFKKTEIGEIPNDWEVRKLKDIGKLKGGNAFKIEYQGMKELKYPFYKVSDMNTKGNEIFMKYSEHTIDEEVKNKLNCYIFPKKTIIFAKVGAALLLNRRRILTTLSCIDNNMMGYEVTNGFYKYMFYVLQTIDFGQFVNEGAMPSINQYQVGNIKISIPPMQEQQKISSILSEVDNKIEQYELRKEKLQNLKKGLMQKLLTGKIRVQV